MKTNECQQNCHGFSLLQIVWALATCSALLALCVLSIYKIVSRTRRPSPAPASSMLSQSGRQSASEMGRELFSLVKSRHSKRSFTAFPRPFGNNEQSRDFYRKLGLPFEWSHFLRMARFYRAAGLYEDAERNILTAIELSPDDVSLHIFLARLFFDRRKFSKAKAAFARALTFDPRSPDALMGLGRTLVRMDEIGEGISRMLTALEMEPGNAEYLAYVGQVYWMYDDKQKGRKYAERALAQDSRALSYINDNELKALLLNCRAD